MKMIYLSLALMVAGQLSAQNRIIVQADLGKDTISRHIYLTTSPPCPIKN
jgi:hypothetical protein